MKHTRTMQRNIVLTTILSVLAAVSIAATLVISDSRKALMNSSEYQITQTNDLTVDLLASWVGDRTANIKLWSGLKSITEYFDGTFEGTEGVERIISDLIEIQESLKWYISLNVASLDGERFASSHTELLKVRGAESDLNASSREYFQAASRGETFISDLLIGKGTGKPLIVIAHPIRLENRIVGVIFAAVDLAMFSQGLILPISVGETGYVYLYDRKGIVAAHPDPQYIGDFDISQQSLGYPYAQRGQAAL